MKKLLLLIGMLFVPNFVSAESLDYQQIYRDLEVPTHKYVHNIDPGEYYDTQTSTWSPYPLFRLIAPIFFKSIAIEPGYYLLTPREHEGEWYILFKEAGRIKYIVPVYNRDITPVTFYDENLPKPELKFSQKVHLKTLDIIGRYVPSAKRKPTPQSYLELTELDNNFVSIIVYWGNHRYHMLFRTIQL